MKGSPNLWPMRWIVYTKGASDVKISPNRIECENAWLMAATWLSSEDILYLSANAMERYI
jgi:hypothetical protein